MTITTHRASKTPALGNCVRCFDPTQAVSIQRLTFGGEEYEWELCDKHADLFHRDMIGWTRAGRLVEAPTTFRSLRRPQDDDSDDSCGRVVAAHIHVPDVVRTDHRPVPGPRSPRVLDVPTPASAPDEPASFAQIAARQVVGSLPKGFEEWTFSDHALERQAARGVSRVEALWCAAEPELVTPNARPNSVVHRRAHVEVVVNPTQKRIITVINQSEEMAHGHNVA